MTLPRLMLVTDRVRVPQRDLVETVRAAVAGGVGAVQLREKDLHDDALVAILERLRRVVPPSTLLIVNGRPAVARATGCGLHLPAAHGTEDRARLPVVGRSVHDVEQTRRGLAEGVDYLIFGPVFPTPSKPGHPGAGLERLAEIVRLSGSMPVFAIGGVQRSNLAAVVQAGAWGVSVCGAILSSPDPTRAAGALRRSLEQAPGHRDRSADNARQRR